MYIDTYIYAIYILYIHIYYIYFEVILDRLKGKEWFWVA